MVPVLLEQITQIEVDKEQMATENATEAEMENAMEVRQRL